MPVQRWRLTFERGTAAAALPQRDIDRAWKIAIAGFRSANALPSEEPRIVMAAPLLVGMTAGLERADLLLPERRRMPDVRAALDDAFPKGHRLVDLHDVWLGEPALPGLVVAGDYRVSIEGPGDAAVQGDRTLTGVADAVRALLDATDLPRIRTKGGRTTAGNLRPLILDVAAADSTDRPAKTLELWMRLRFHPSLGTGRPEEVVAALSSITGQPLAAVRLHRERLWLQGELPE